MTTFAVRVELHGATGTDYEELHAAMGARGIVRTGTFGNVLYHLPTGEYQYEGSSDETPLSVCIKAQAVASTIKANPAVFVTQSAGSAAGGLTPVTTPANALLGLGIGIGLNPRNPAPNLLQSLWINP